ncbi:hypothetical protein ElyMa_004314200 [Elysia marginata]|uniref:PiggyBac transposable element-derived protein domain-containing protein n=1 Tax=Elysia marginata TaxID=1093978 RepID=A0AAV4H0I8_9GAST|nr:hypothetical protein ElyMa_004314200 [Elysia marginata]
MEHKFWLTEDSKMMCVAWRDKKANKPVFVTSTKGKVENVAVIHSYNFSRNGCDRADQMLSQTNDRKKYKGLKMFKLRLVDELCEVAATLLQIQHSKYLQNQVVPKLQILLNALKAANNNSVDTR